MDAHAWDERYAAAETVWSVEPNRFVAAECADLPLGRALDLAAGEGRNAIWLARRGWEVTAVDFSAVAVEKGRRLAGEVPVDWVVGDVVTGAGLEPVDGPGFDLCVVAYLQLAAVERREAVRRALTALRSGGTLLWVAHDSSNLTEGTGGPQDPAVLMTAQDVLADLDSLLTEAGAEGAQVEVVRAERVARPVEGPDGVRTAYDALVRVIRRPPPHEASPAIASKTAGSERGESAGRNASQ